MTLRRKFLLYLILIHLVFAASAAVFLWQHRIWLLAVEAFFVLSLFLGVRLLHRLVEPVRLIRSGVDLMSSSDFTTRFRETGRPEVDELIRLYNRMVDELREQRVRSEEQEHFLQRVLEVSPSGTLLLDLDGKIHMANEAAARLLGIDRDQLTGLSLPELESPLAQDLAGLDPQSSRVTTLGGARRVRCWRSSFMDRGFPRTFFLLEELTEELRRSQKAAYDKLIRLMSHEVNNTTGAVASLLESCLNYAPQIGDSDRSDYTTALDVAIQRSRHMNEFMKRFADVVRLPKPHREPTDIAELVGGIVRLLDADLRRQMIDVRWDTPERLERIPLDPVQMEQVFVNVLRNAMEAIGSEGHITVRLRRNGHRGQVEIEDSGPGIAPEVQEHLFTPFYTTKENGQGIGLTLVGEILQAHGFDYSLDGGAEAPTRFTIVFGEAG